MIAQICGCELCDPHRHLGDDLLNADPTVYATYPADLSYTAPSDLPLTGEGDFLPLDTTSGDSLLNMPTPVSDSGLNLLDPNNPYIQNPSSPSGSGVTAAQIAALAAQAAKTGALIANPTPSPNVITPLAQPAQSLSSWLASQSLMAGYSNEEILVVAGVAVVGLSLLMSRGSSTRRKK